MQNGVRIGSFAGAPVIIEPAFLLLAAYVVGSDLLRNGVAALPDALVYVGVIFAAVLIHEFGHAAAAAALQIPSKRIVLTFFGGYVEFVRQPAKPWQEIVVSAAGPGANLATTVLIASAMPLLTQALPSTEANFTALGALQTFSFISLLLGLFNLLPGFPLDGGHILRAALSYLMPRANARAGAAICGLIVAAGLGLLALSGMMIWTGFIAALLGLAAWAELAGARAEMRRQRAGSGTRSNA